MGLVWVYIASSISISLLHDCTFIHPLRSMCSWITCMTMMSASSLHISNMAQPINLLSSSLTSHRPIPTFPYTHYGSSSRLLSQTVRNMSIATAIVETRFLVAWDALWVLSCRLPLSALALRTCFLMSMPNSPGCGQTVLFNCSW